jgi:hypothetical protein
LVGWQNDPRFTDGSFWQIYRETGGVPRKINALCSRLMLFGFLEETHLVDEQTVVQVAEELKTELGDVTATAQASSLTESKSAPSAAAAGDELDARLTKIEQKLDRNDQAIKRALALIAASLDKDSP